MDTREVHLERRRNLQKEIEFVMPDLDFDDEFYSESCDFINQLPVFKQNHKKKSLKFMPTLVTNNDRKFSPVKNRLNSAEIKKKMEKVVLENEILEEKVLRQISPKVNYFSKKSRLNTVQSNDQKAHRLTYDLRRSPTVSPEIQKSLISVSLNKKNLSETSHTNLFFPLLIRKNHSKSLMPTRNLTKSDPKGFFFVQSISYLKPKNVKA